MSMQEKRSPLEYPFLDYQGIMYVLGDICKKDQAYKIIHYLLNEIDDDGNLLIDPKRVPTINKLIVPTDIFCKRFGIDRDRYK